jgi:DNA polymerase III subunit delta
LINDDTLIRRESLANQAWMALASAVATKPKKTAPASRIYVVIGSDEGQVREESHRLYRELTGGVDDDFTHETIEGHVNNAEQADRIIGQTLQALQTYSMFGGDKVVWLRNVSFMGNERTAEAESVISRVEELGNVLRAGLGSGVSFVISATKIDKRRSFWKFLEAHASVAVFEKIDTSREGWEEEVAQLVLEKAKGCELDFEDDALELFIMQAGEATNQIVNELEKLRLYLGDRKTVTLADVRVMVPLSRVGVVFETGRALQTGDVERAIELIDEQLEQGESGVGIMRASIIPTVRNLFMARILIERAKASAYNYRDFETAVNRLPASEKAWLPQKKSGDGVNVYPLFLCARGAMSFTLEALEKIFHLTAKTDKMLVSSGLDEKLLLHRLVTEIAIAAAPRKATSRTA